MNAIKKAIIPCGGLGTRFLPATKAVPKEILPVIDTPVLAYIVEELAASGVEQVMIILGTGKEAIRDYFTDSPRLEAALENKPELLEKYGVSARTSKYGSACRKTRVVAATLLCARVTLRARSRSLCATATT